MNAQFPYLPLFQEHQYTNKDVSDSPVPEIHTISAINVSLPHYSALNGSISSEWIPVPHDELPTLSNGTQGQTFPSAMMAIRLPFPNSTSSGQTLTCSIDARWAQGTFVQLGTQTAINHKLGLLRSRTNRDLISVSEGLTSTGRRQAGARPFSPIDDGSWRTVNLSNEWLQAITPRVMAGETNNTAAMSTIGDLLIDTLLFSESSTVDQGIGWFRDQCNFHGNSTLQMWQPKNGSSSDCMAQVSTRAEIIITAVVLDAMSRVNSPSDLGGHVNESVSVGAWLDDGTQYDALLRRKASSQKYNGGDNDPTHVTCRWEVFISGYAYTVNGVAGILSLTILYLYIAIVVCHIGLMLWRRESSDSWEAPEEMIALAMTSEPPADGILQNAASGIRCRRTYKTMVRVRAHANKFYSMTGTRNEVGMRFGGESSNLDGEEVILPNRKY